MDGNELGIILMKNMVRCSLLVLMALVFTFFGINGILRYTNYRGLESEARQLQHDIQAADSMGDHRLAIASYEKLKTDLPEVQLRVLQRQWLVGLEILHQIQLAKYNTVLERDLPVLYDTLRDHLEEMKNKCSLVLTDDESLPGPISWRVHNIRAAASLLSAFIVLESERNWKKVTGTMKDAISDFKSAISKVESVQTKGFERNIPRWNLELLHGEQYIKKLKFTRPEAEQRLELRDNLEAIIPEKGGYAPGEPVEVKVEK
jgi:hypothetical protein